MKRWMKWLAAVIIAFSLALPDFAKAATFAETEEVFRHVLESHLSKPQESQLVQGALQHIRDMAEKEKNMRLAVRAQDDTLADLRTRIQEWKRLGGWDDSVINSWAIEGMLASLDDPHTTFFTEQDLLFFQSSVENQFVGFGFRLRIQEGSFIIREIVPESPASASPLQRGDRIVEVDGESLADKTLEEAYLYLRGEEGSESLLKVYRPSEDRYLEVKLQRALMTLPEAVGEMFDWGGIGYIRLETFGSDAAYQMQDALNAFSKSGTPLTGLVLDVRDNGGGYLSAARDIAGLFMEEGILMYTTNRNGVEVETWVRNGRDIGVPVRILVNGGSASASELLSGALRDHGIAELVGTTTYGKGSAQQVLLLSGGDALKLTLNEYFTPKRTVVNHVGLNPDLMVEDDGAQVVAALRSLGIRSWEISDRDGDTVINGIPFPTVHPVFQEGVDGLEVRAAVLAELIGAADIGLLEYVRLAPYLEANPSLQLQNKNGEITLSYTSK